MKPYKDYEDDETNLPSTGIRWLRMSARHSDYQMKSYRKHKKENGKGL